MKRILFVCLGNICRSSSAEEVMRTLIKKKGLEHEIEVDSAGILSYHRGELPDSRMRMHASRRGYNLTHRSRPVCTEDFYHFDMIIGMDDRNIEDLMERAPDLETEKKIHRMRIIAAPKWQTMFPTLTMAVRKGSRTCLIYWKMLVQDCLLP